MSMASIHAYKGGGGYCCCCVIILIWWHTCMKLYKMCSVYTLQTCSLTAISIRQMRQWFIESRIDYEGLNEITTIIYIAILLWSWRKLGGRDITRCSSCGEALRIESQLKEEAKNISCGLQHFWKNTQVTKWKSLRITVALISREPKVGWGCVLVLLKFFIENKSE